MSNYSKTTDFAAKDSLPSGDSGKIIRGSEFETEFDAISTAIATKADAADPTFTGTVTIDGLTVNGNTTLGNAATDTVTVTADIASNLIPSADDTYNLGASGAEWNDLFIDGTANIDSLVADTADINGGTIDGVTIGGSSAGAGTFTSITTTGNVTFGDNDKAIFGAGSDLQIYHDGSASRIQDVGTGDLIISATDFALRGYTANESMINAVNNGAVTLYYDNAAKVATTSTGVNVTGTVVADGLDVDTSAGVTLNGTGTGATHQINRGTAATDNTRPVVALNADTTGDAADGFGATIKFELSDSGVDNSELGAIGFKRDGGDGLGMFTVGQDSQLLHTARQFTVAANGDVGFYEDTGTTAKFFWDASAESLGIGTTSPATKLEVANTSAGVDLALRSSTTGTSSLYFGDSDSIIQGRVAYDNSNNSLAFTTAASERVRIDSSGNVGIGTNSPAQKLVIDGGSSNAIVRIQGDSVLRLDFGPSTDADAGRIEYNSSGNSMRFYTNNSEAVRISSGGHLLVGKTSQDQTDTVGVELKDDGLVVATTSGSQTLTLNRKTSDGDIVQFRKDNSTVGSIGANVSRFYIHGTYGSGSGLRFDNASIRPATSTGTSSDNTTDLGASAARFKDLYLSGVSYLGGNVLVSKTSSGTNNVGSQISGDGYTAIVTTNTNIPLYLENKATNGNCRISFTNNSHGGSSLGLNNGGDFTIFDSTAGTTRFNVTNAKVITASGGLAGIELGGTGTSNRLDDYEEGTWTPVVIGTTTSGTATYSTQYGKYTKVGNIVFIQFYVTYTGHTGTGDLRISGLPFTAYSQSGLPIGDISLLTKPADSMFTCSTVFNSTLLRMRTINTASGTGSSDLAMDAAATINISGVYRID